MRKKPCLKRALLAVLALSIINGGSSGMSSLSAGDKRVGAHKHDDVLRHRQSHDILPFDEVLKAVRSRIKGDIIETEFEIEDGIPVYEIKYIDISGRVLEIYIDAKTGVVLKEEVD